MLLKNTARRLITISTPLVTQKDEVTGKIIGATKGECYDVKPAGKSVKVPDALCSTPYVKALLKTGDLIAVDEVEIEEDEPSEFEGMTKADLVEYAELEGVEIKSTMSKSAIIAAIESAKE